MQVKKFEAPTLQEALETIKRELGPEAIILQTKQNRRGFGLMSKGSVEVTAAVSERATAKKNSVDKRLPEAYSQKINQLPADKQADVYESYLEKRIERDKVQLSSKAQEPAKRMTAVRYADIIDDEEEGTATKSAATTYSPPAPKRPIPNIHVPKNIENSLETYQNAQQTLAGPLEEEIKNLKRLVEELRRERRKPEYLDTDSPFDATEALQEAYELLMQTGVERRFAIQIMREAAKNLDLEARADSERVLDSIAEQLLKNTEIKPFFKNHTAVMNVVGFVGVSGVGKTALIAKLATHATRVRKEKIGIIRVQLSKDEGSDPLVVFAKAIHVPYRIVQNSDELISAMQDLSQCQYLFIDTPGVSPRDAQAIQKLQIMLRCDSRIKIEFVVSSTTRDLELHEQAKALSGLKPESLMFTKLDEAYSFGAIYSLSKRLHLPVSVFSTGKKVTEDWENASAERLTASILNIL